MPFFVAHAQQIANAISAANPHSNVSFALVDYFASLDGHDDGDGKEYHVDIPQFVTSGSFGGQVQSTFQAEVLGGGYIYGDSDLSDNILHSSVITALYGAIIGSGLDWSPQTHHVIVWMGSTAPRDPNYVENYAVSASDDDTGESGTCEPSYSFGALASPNCEGWVRSQDGNSTHSIAGLARSSPTCTDSIGGVCTVDTIDLYATPTDPTSSGWPCPGGPTGTMAQIGGCPDGVVVRENVAHVLLAGCDLASATGGTWDGPEFFSCPNGQNGGLQPVFVGSDPYEPNLNNPSLFTAFREVGFGPVVGTQVANGTGTPDLPVCSPRGDRTRSAPTVPRELPAPFGAALPVVRPLTDDPELLRPRSAGMELEHEPSDEPDVPRRCLDGFVPRLRERASPRHGSGGRGHDCVLQGRRERFHQRRVHVGDVHPLLEQYRGDAILPVRPGQRGGASRTSALLHRRRLPRRSRRPSRCPLPRRSPC